MTQVSATTDELAWEIAAIASNLAELAGNLETTATTVTSETPR